MVENIAEVVPQVFSILNLTSCANASKLSLPEESSFCFVISKINSSSVTGKLNHRDFSCILVLKFVAVTYEFFAVSKSFMSDEES